MSGQLDLFGYDTVAVQRKRGRNEIFTDYEAYVAKFADAPKTTDDTYTPPDVYEAVVGWLSEKGKITGGTRIIRPFYPGGDFEGADYPPGCAVIDNPPFSIVSKVCKWYVSRGIGFFLFCPALTSARLSDFCTVIQIGVPIRFENGVRLPVAFASNMFGSAAAIAAGDLTQKIDGCESQKKDTKEIRKIQWPAEVLTVSALRSIAADGGAFELDRRCSVMVLKIGGEEIFGGAWLSAEAAKAAKAAEEAKAAKAAKAEEAAKAKRAKAVKVELLPSEKETFERLCKACRGKSGREQPENARQK